MGVPHSNIDHGALKEVKIVGTATSGILQADVGQNDDFQDEFDQIINQLIDEDSGIDSFEMNLPKLGISIVKGEGSNNNNSPTSTVSSTLADISSYPEFGFNISVSEDADSTGWVPSLEITYSVQCR